MFERLQRRSKQTGSTTNSSSCSSGRRRRRITLNDRCGWSVEDGGRRCKCCISPFSHWWSGVEVAAIGRVRSSVRSSPCKMHDTSDLGHAAQTGAGVAHLCTEDGLVSGRVIAEEGQKPALGRSAGQLMVALGGTSGSIGAPPRRACLRQGGKMARSVVPQDRRGSASATYGIWMSMSRQVTRMSAKCRWDDPVQKHVDASMAVDMDWHDAAEDRDGRHRMGAGFVARVSRKTPNVRWPHHCSLTGEA